MVEGIIWFMISFVIGMLCTYKALEITHTKIQKKREEIGYLKI